MTIFRLPTSQDRGYRGKRPSAIRTFSTAPDSRDVAGDRCVHIETNDGTRYTVSLNLLRELKSYEGITGKIMWDVVTTGEVYRLSQDQYDRWLSGINAARAAKRSK